MMLKSIFTVEYRTNVNEIIVDKDLREELIMRVDMLYCERTLIT